MPHRGLSIEGFASLPHGEVPLLPRDTRDELEHILHTDNLEDVHTTLSSAEMSSKLHEGLDKLLASSWREGKTKFQGNAFTEYMGILYLLTIHNKDCSPVKSDMMVASHVSGVTFSDYEVVYENPDKILLPPGFSDSFSACVAGGARYVFMMLDVPGHSNCLIFDTSRSSLERFDSYGSDGPPVCDDNIWAVLAGAGVRAKTYLKPRDYMPHAALQMREELGVEADPTQRLQGDPRGFCAAWSLWYLHMLLSTAHIFPPSMSAKRARSLLLKEAHKHIDKSPHTYRKFIRGFSVFLTDAVKKLRDAKSGPQRANRLQKMRKEANR